MTRHLRTLFVIALSCTLTTACVESSKTNDASGKAALIAVNAIVDAPDVTFLIEERSLGTAAFAGSTAAIRYDDLSYTFNFDISVPGESDRRRLASRLLDVIKDTTYLFALGGTVASPKIYLWENGERQWDGDETVFELAVAHLNNSLGPVDVYFAEPGTTPVSGNEIGTIDLGDRLPPAEFAAGNYVLTLTTAGNAQSILYTSDIRTWLPSTTDTLVILDRDPSRTGNIMVRRISESGSSGELADPRFAPTTRLLHAAAGIDNIDVAENGNYTTLVADDLAFGDITGDTPLTAGENSYTVTDAGNQGAVLFDGQFTIGTGTRRTLTLVGPPGDLDVITSLSVRRPYATSGRIAFLNAVSAYETVDIYLLEAGESIDDYNATLPFVPFKTPVSMVPIVAENYEVTIAVSGEKTVLAGPLPVAISNGDVVEVFVLDTADPNVADFEVVRYTP